MQLEVHQGAEAADEHAGEEGLEGGGDGEVAKDGCEGEVQREGAAGEGRGGVDDPEDGDGALGVEESAGDEDREAGGEQGAALDGDVSAWGGARAVRSFVMDLSMSGDAMVPPERATLA